MDGKKIVLLIGALLIAVTTAFMARSWLGGSDTPQAAASNMVNQADMPHILVATKALPVGTILDPTAFRFQPWPKELMENTYYLQASTNVQTLPGQVVRNAISAGSPLTIGSLIKPGERGFLAAALGAGMRAVTVPVSVNSSVAGFVFPGDRIDLVLTQSVPGGGDGQPLKVSETILRNLRVLATDQRMDAMGADGKPVVQPYGNVTLEVTPKIAEKLSVAQTIGSLSLSLRSIADNTSELESAIASGDVKVPEGNDPKSDKAMMLALANRPNDGRSTFATGADVSRFQRSSVPAKAAMMGGAPTVAGAMIPAPAAAPPKGPVVRVWRGATVTIEIRRGQAMISTHNMPRKAVSALALGIAAMGGLSAPVALNAQPVVGTMTNAAPVILSVGGSQVVNLPSPMSDYVIADPSVVDVVVRSQTQLFLIAKKPGETSVVATSTGGKILYSSIVRVGNNITSIDQMMRMAMPDADVQISTLNGIVVLTGTIKAPEDAAEAERITQALVGKDVTVISRLRTATPLQVNLRVRISEVNRSLLHKIGTNFKSFDPGGNNNIAGFVGRETRDIGTFVTDKASPNYRSFTYNFPTDGSTNLGALAHLLGVDVAGALDLAENNGLATSLAEPNLTSLSGETASFLAGGEYPYQVSNGTQGNSIEFKQYGVQLAFTPTILSDGRISLRVRPTVSTLDFSINASIPALKTRTAETTVELGSGQAFMIAGLMSNDSANTVGKIPGIGNVPILGSLFKSRQFQRNETELVIVVTPYLVKPMNANDALLPTDGFRTATEAEGLLLQKGADGKSGEPGNHPVYVPPADAVTPPQAPSGKKRADKGAAPGFTF